MYRNLKMLIANNKKESEFECIPSIEKTFEDYKLAENDSLLIKFVKPFSLKSFIQVQKTSFKEENGLLF